MKMRHAWMCAAVLAATLSVVACESRKVTDTRDVGFEIQPSTRELLVGEIVTVTTRSENLLGRDAEIQWRSTGGRLTTEDNNRIARVRFDEPGTYTIGASVNVGGQQVVTDDTTITVRAIR